MGLNFNSGDSVPSSQENIIIHTKANLTRVAEVESNGTINVIHFFDAGGYKTSAKVSTTEDKYKEDVVR